MCGCCRWRKFFLFGFVVEGALRVLGIFRKKKRVRDRFVVCYNPKGLVSFLCCNSCAATAGRLSWGSHGIWVA